MTKNKNLIKINKSLAIQFKFLKKSLANLEEATTKEKLIDHDAHIVIDDMTEIFKKRLDNLFLNIENKIEFFFQHEE